MHRFRILIAVLVSVASVAVSAQPSDEDIAAFVDGYLAREVAARTIPGAAIVLLRDGRPIFARGYGVADYATGRPMSIDDSVLRQGSTAKLFVWVLAMQLVEEGRLDLDADIQRYLDFRIPGAPITMRHLMTHSAGFAERMPMLSAETRRAPLGVQVRENMPERVYVPGGTVAYSNYGAALAGYVVERLRGKPFERLVEERIFAPLQMTRSTVAQPVPETLQPLLASHYSASSRTPAPFDVVGLAPAGSASASPADMGRFTAMLMNGGGVLRPETLVRMMALRQPLAPTLPAGLGHGFIVGEYRGVRYAGHGGSMGAGTTDLEILPEPRLGWYLAFNGRGENGSALPLRQELLRAVIDRFYARPAAAPHAAGPSGASSIANTYLPTRRLHSGVMQLFAAFDSLSVKSDGDALIIELENGTTRWLPAGRDRFVEQRTGLPLAVARDDAGRVIRLASPLLNGVTQYEPAPVSVRLLPVLLLGPVVLLVAAAIAPFRARRPFRVASLSFAFVVLTVPTWAVWLTSRIVAPGALGSSDVLLRILNLLSMATPIAAAVLVLHALRTWRNASGWLAAGRTVTACASMAVVWLYFAFDFAAF